MTGAKNPLVVKFADAKNKESNDSQVRIGIDSLVLCQSAI